MAHWTDHGTANTPTAGGELSIDADVTITKDDDGHLSLNTSISTSNGALTDNGTGCVKTNSILLSNGTPTSTFKVLLTAKIQERDFLLMATLSGRVDGKIKCRAGCSSIGFGFAFL